MRPLSEIYVSLYQDSIKSKFLEMSFDLCHRPATSSVHYTTSCNTQSSAPNDGRYFRPKNVELIGIINKPLLLHLVGCLHYGMIKIHLLLF